MIGYADGVLREGGIVVAVGIGKSRPEVLQVIVRNRVGVGAEGSERKSGLLRLEGERIHLDDVEKIFAILLAGIVIVNPGDERVAPELEGVAAGIEAESLGKLAAVFARGPGEQVGAPDTVENVGDFDERVAGVGVG